MWRFVVLVAAAAALSGAVTSLPADMDMVADIVSKVKALTAEEHADDTVTPELAELYHDVDLLWQLQKANLTDSREGRGLLSKLSFLTGLKLGGLLTSSGTLAASNSFTLLGKVLNTALSVSYGNVGGGYGGIPESPVVGLQELPDLPAIKEPDGNYREQHNLALELAGSPAKHADETRKEFIKVHNQRVDKLNSLLGIRLRGRTGRTET